MKSTLNKLLFLFLLIFPLFSNNQSLFNDTVNVRKDFFYQTGGWQIKPGSQYQKVYHDNKITIHQNSNQSFDFIFYNSILGEKTSYQFINRLQVVPFGSKSVIIFHKHKKDIDEIFFAPFPGDLKVIKQNYSLKDLIYYFSNQMKRYGSISYQFDQNKKLKTAKVYFLDNPGSYLFFDQKRARKFDVWLFGHLYRSDLSYYFNFESLKYLSLNSILSLLKENKIDRELLIEKDDSNIKLKFINKIIYPIPHVFEQKFFETQILKKLWKERDRQFILAHYKLNHFSKQYELNEHLKSHQFNKIKKLLITVNYLGHFKEDGARNEFGEYVYIKSGKLQEGQSGLNCSGYAKEVADQYIRLFQGDFKWLSINKLKRKRKSERISTHYEQYEESYDPYFGSDWVKNIVDQINVKCNYQTIRAHELNNDKYSAYFKASGYYFEDLLNILYRDQQKDSTYFYMIVLSQLRRSKPIIPEYFHIAVIIPYFSGHQFVLRIFESNRETSYLQLLKNQLPNYINASRFQTEVLKKLTQPDEKEFILKSYRLSNNRRYYYLNPRIDLKKTEKILRIFTRLDFKNKKVLIYKIPIPLIYFMGEKG